MSVNKTRLWKYYIKCEISFKCRSFGQVSNLQIVRLSRMRLYDIFYLRNEARTTKKFSLIFKASAHELAGGCEFVLFLSLTTRHNPFLPVVIVPRSVFSPISKANIAQILHWKMKVSIIIPKREIKKSGRRHRLWKALCAPFYVYFVLGCLRSSSSSDCF